MSTRRPLLALLVALALAPGCTPTPVAPKPSTPPTGRVATPKPLPTVAGNLIAGTSDAVRRIEAGSVVQLTGKVKVISDYGLGLISDNGAVLISDKGAGIGPSGEARVISNNGGGMIGKTKFRRLLQAATAEDFLANATIEVRDAAGRVLQDAQGQPITATSDASGSYTLAATLPPENLVLRVRLGNGGGLHGGELTALVAAKNAAGPLPVSLDTASSLGAAYVLATYVKGDQAVLDRLPHANAEALSAGMEAARARLPLTAPIYAADALAAAAATLRTQDPPLDQTLTAIEAILLAGQAQLGEGLAATSVPLSGPLSLARDAAGALYIAESVAGRIRKIAPDGTVTLFAGAGTLVGRREQPDAFQALFTSLTDLIATPDEGFVVAEAEAHQVRAIAPDGRVTVVAGTGSAGQGALGGLAADTAITRPTCLARAADGTLAIGEVQSGGVPARVLTVDAQGKLGELTPPGNLAGSQVSGLAYAPDGTLWVATGTAKRLLSRSPQGAWRTVVDTLDMTDLSRLTIAPDGGVYLSETRAQRVVHVAPDGIVTPLAGSGQSGYTGDGGPPLQARLSLPAGLLSLPDGRLAVVDAGNMVIRAFDPRDPQAPLTTIAGTNGVVQQGAGTTIAVNGPVGLAIDPQGQVVFSELGGSTLKRLADGAVTLLAGSASGYADGPALAAAFNTPGGLAYGPDGSLWVLDTVKARLRRLRPDGIVETAVGTGLTGAVAGALTLPRLPGLSHDMGRPLFVAVGPDGRPYWTDNGLNVVLRLAADGQVERVAGALPAVFDKSGGKQDGPAAAAKFDRPAGLVFDAAGDLYVADLGNMAIRKITRPGTPEALVSTIAGRPMAETFGKLIEGNVAQPDGLPGADALFFGPLSLALDAQGRLLVGEIGTARIDALVDVPLIALLPSVSPARVRRIDLRDAAYPVSTVVGPGSRALADAYGDQALGLPLGLAFDRAGRLIVADGANNQVRLIPSAAL